MRADQRLMRVARLSGHDRAAEVSCGRRFTHRRPLQCGQCSCSLSLDDILTFVEYPGPDPWAFHFPEVALVLYPAEQKRDGSWDRGWGSGVWSAAGGGEEVCRWESLTGARCGTDDRPVSTDSIGSWPAVQQKSYTSLHVVVSALNDSLS